MQTIYDIAEWQALREQIDPKHAIALVPTMGNLHAGHASLLDRARKENQIVVLSIFVRTQFNETQDYKSYPRTLAADLMMAEQLGVDYVFIPDKEAMYPDGFSFKITESTISQYQEGKYRPGHFAGMLTIVLKLLLLVQPQHAYFGEKDYQQLQLIRGLCQAFFLNINIVACPILREDTGLPLSSRNNLLTPAEKELAHHFAKIFQQLQLSCEEVIQELTQAGIVVDYIEDLNQRRFAAVRTGRVRLIDNREIPC